MAAKTGPDGHLIPIMSNSKLLKDLLTAKKKVKAKIRTELSKRKVSF